MVIITVTSLQLAFYEFFMVVVAQATQTARFKTPLKRLQNTLQSIEPVFYESYRLGKVLDRPQKETILFISYLKREKRLVLKSSTVTSLNKYQTCLHSDKLTRLNNNLIKFFHTELLPVLTSHVSVGVDSNLEECFMDLDLFPRDEACDSNQYDLTAPKDDELRLDVRSQNFSIPEFINKMDQLKVLTIKGHCDYPSKIHNLSSLACLSNLTTLRFEHVSFPSIQPIFALRILKKLSFVMCEIGDGFMSFTNHSAYTLPNLTHLEIDMCYDLKQLPLGVCNLVDLQKLSITNCHELVNLPKELGALSNIESLSLHSCTKLQELPESIGSLCNLSSIDISDCLSISVLPEEIGELCGLRVLKMNGCTGLQELPMSVSELWQLEEVICDEETSYLWMDFESDLHNLKIKVVEDDRLETFMKIVQ